MPGKRYLLIFLLLTASSSFCEVPPSLPHRNGAMVSPGISTWRLKHSGFNIKLSPAIFWRTMVVEMELPLNKHFSVGLNLLGKLRDSDKRSTVGEDLYKPGWGAEFAVKYYFKGEAPEGIYVHLNAGYSTIFYYDGNTRPYTLHNHWRQKEGGDFKKPLPYYLGLGAGYQLVLLPDHFIGNILFGIQGNVYDNNVFPLSFYLLPSLGYKF